VDDGLDLLVESLEATIGDPQLIRKAADLEGRRDSV
jgi:hypothetical protein